MVRPRVLVPVVLAMIVGLALGTTFVDVPARFASYILLGALFGIGLLTVNITYAKAGGATRLVVLLAVFSFFVMITL